jgi:hypothetical protein
MFDKALDRLTATGIPRLFLMAGYVLGIVAILGMWDPPPGGGEAPPTWWIATFLLWVVGYPASLGAVWQRAKDDGVRTERQRRDAFEE